MEAPLGVPHADDPPPGLSGDVAPGDEWVPEKRQRLAAPEHHPIANEYGSEPNGLTDLLSCDPEHRASEVDGPPLKSLVLPESFVAPEAVGPASSRTRSSTVRSAGAPAESATAPRTKMQRKKQRVCGPGRVSAPALGPFRQQLIALISRNRQPYYPGTWHRSPLPQRPYHPIEEYEVPADIPAPEAVLCADKLRTDLPEGWVDVESLVDHRLDPAAAASTSALPLGPREGLHLNIDVVEKDMWGIDCYTRQCILDVLGLCPCMASPQAREDFLERYLLPAIQRQGPMGWDITPALQDVAATASKTRKMAIRAGAHMLLRAVAEADAADYAAEVTLVRPKGEPTAAAALAAGGDRETMPGDLGPWRTTFRVHPKGVGVVCSRLEGIPPRTFVADYLGELYPPWRWFEKQDMIRKRNPHQDLPDFYNVCLERPKEDSRGYDILFVEAARRTSFASRLSHSCDPNCRTVVTSANGRLTLAVYTSRQINHGEELSWDYASVTESEREFRAAICLCGATRCRGSFLYYANSVTFTEILSSSHTFLDRNAAIVRAGTEPLTEDDLQCLEAKGLQEAAFRGAKGMESPPWLRKWVALIVQFIDQEYADLPEALKHNRHITDAEAALDSAKGVRDHRLQNLVITLNKILYCLSQPCQPQDPPLRLLPDPEVVKYLWSGPDSIMRRWQKAAEARGALSGPVLSVLDTRCATAHEARRALRMLSSALRDEGPTHVPASVMLLLYGTTENWVDLSKYVGFTTSVGDCRDPAAQTKGSGRTHATRKRPPPPEEKCRRQVSLTPGDPTEGKKYMTQFIWGQLSAWFKQTIYDPSASLSAERRGTVSLPDPESAYNRPINRKAQTWPEGQQLLSHLENTPDRYWPVAWQWNFKNPRKVYGSPFLDAALAHSRGEPHDLGPLFQELRAICNLPPPKGAPHVPPTPTVDPFTDPLGIPCQS